MAGSGAAEGLWGDMGPPWVDMCHRRCVVLGGLAGLRWGQSPGQAVSLLLPRAGQRLPQCQAWWMLSLSFTHHGLFRGPRGAGASLRWVAALCHVHVQKPVDRSYHLPGRRGETIMGCECLPAAAAS